MSFLFPMLSSSPTSSRTTPCGGSHHVNERANLWAVVPSLIVPTPELDEGAGAQHVPAAQQRRDVDVERAVRLRVRQQRAHGAHALEDAVRRCPGVLQQVQADFARLQGNVCVHDWRDEAYRWRAEGVVCRDLDFEEPAAVCVVVEEELLAMYTLVRILLAMSLGSRERGGRRLPRGAIDEERGGGSLFHTIISIPNPPSINHSLPQQQVLIVDRPEPLDAPLVLLFPAPDVKLLDEALDRATAVRRGLGLLLAPNCWARWV